MDARLARATRDRAPVVQVIGPWPFNDTPVVTSAHRRDKRYWVVETRWYPSYDGVGGHACHTPLFGPVVPHEAAEWLALELARQAREREAARPWYQRLWTRATDLVARAHRLGSSSLWRRHATT